MREESNGACEPEQVGRPFPPEAPRQWLLRATVIACVAAVAAATPTSGVAGSAVGAADAPSMAIQAFTVPGFSTANSATIGSQTSNAVQKVIPGVVSIVSRLSSQNASVAGTGMVLRSSGEVLTNNHVVQDTAGITVTVAGSGRTFTADIVGTDPTDDVAVLQLKSASGLVTVPIGDSSKVVVGDSVAAIGNAEGGAPSVVAGTVKALNQSITATDSDGGNAEQLTGLIKSDVPIKPGFSGGPLISTTGEVIGMDTAATALNEYLPAGLRAGYSIPINHAVSVAKQLESGKTTAAGHVATTGLRSVPATHVQMASGRVVDSVGAVDDQSGRNAPDSPMPGITRNISGGPFRSRPRFCSQERDS
ncbi:trypsin-like peptidase domain-containing protein [Frankia sp. Cppng1_Ct_nod]|uniref:S1C family serine protease n=1 Tax=Frankia sp. Cppng1_Ct_nod TaxID=2897162 RepID=UPI001041648B|nr:trypsin-like peptidase domain-containing protein [Frankia sp. Cppng1_Ct_nod]